METECFREILNIVALAKELYNIGRYDVVKKNFYDIICCDTYYENMINAIDSIFYVCHIKYDEATEEDCMIFMDDIISQYYRIAWEYEKANKILREKNPYITAAAKEVQRWLNFSYSLGWKLLGYTKNEAKAKKSRLIVYTCNYEFCEHDQLAYGLIMIYKWFSEQCAEYKKKKEATAA